MDARPRLLSRTVYVRMPVDLAAALERAATKSMLSISDVVRQGVLSELKARGEYQVPPPNKDYV